MVGTVRDGRVALTQTRRFTNGAIPLPTREGERLFWDMLHLWNEVREGHRGGDVAARGAAHAVGEDEEVRAGVARILVVGTDEAHVGAGSVVELNRVS